MAEPSARRTSARPASARRTSARPASARRTTGPAHDPAEYVEAVLEVVDQIPPGRVMSYGAIAEYLAARFERGSARRVGTIMALHGGSVPWHRVVSAAGRTPPGHEVKARRKLAAEGVTFRGERVDIAAHGWFPGAG